MNTSAHPEETPTVRRCWAPVWFMTATGPWKGVCGLRLPHDGGHALVSGIGDRACTKAEARWAEAQAQRRLRTP